MTLKRVALTLTALLLSASISATAFAQDAPSAAETREANLKAYVDLLRKDLKKEKVAILTELMQLSPEEAAKFWPVYTEYAEVEATGTRRCPSGCTRGQSLSGRLWTSGARSSSSSL